MRRTNIPDAAIRRLPVYLRVVSELAAADVPIISSAELAEKTGLSPEQIRKDLAYFGAFGTRGVGYDTAMLSRRIARILGIHRGVKAALVGFGHLGHALARYSLTQHKDIVISAIFDVDPEKVGQDVLGVRVQPVSEMVETCRKQGVKIGIITVPASAAQATAELLKEGGVEAILNFAPAKLSVDGVFVQNIDLTIELQSLAYYTSASEDDAAED